MSTDIPSPGISTVCPINHKKQKSEKKKRERKKELFELTFINSLLKRVSPLSFPFVPPPPMTRP